jgi:DNA (cytosine-5)-methyltransferase 1
MRVASLFSGIGGFELGLHGSGAVPVLQCEIDPLAKKVLQSHFPDIDFHNDVTALKSLPECDMLVAGWPCQDLSQAGRMAGLNGANSGLVEHVFRLLDATNPKPSRVILENVAFSLSLQKGRAIQEVTAALEERGYRWAYRIFDTNFFGLPQRRRRIYIYASLVDDPVAVLFDGPHEDSPKSVLGQVSPANIGFYWTEGNRGVGWTVNAVPPLKGGSALSIPSPPAIWHQGESLFSMPDISDAERLQGFPKNWTKLETEHDRQRWKLVGNAVSVPVVKWIASRIQRGAATWERNETRKGTRTSNAAFGGPKATTRHLFGMHEGPAGASPATLEKFPIKRQLPLSARAASGFLNRYKKSKLRKNEQFLAELTIYCDSLNGKS